MALLIVAFVVWSAGGALAVLAGRGRTASGLGTASAVAGCILAATDAIRALVGGSELRAEFAWRIPFGRLSLALDPLSAIFVLAIATVCGLAAIYGFGYLRTYEGRKHLGAAWCFFNLLTASMVLVVTARNAMLFLVAWEMMALVSFFLVMFEAERESVRQAGWTYLVASHLGTAFLLAMFVILGQGRESLDFELLAARPENAGLLFVLAIVGFGTKAGFVPLHVWLPEAHPAAPSHVSAVMSGVMIKMGIYGVLRTLMFLGPPAPWWGWTLVAIGASSGVLGVLFALAQHDLKRLLAYSSVENIGIIALGLGVGLLGISYGNAPMAALGLAGAILHVVNHAMFKSLLFLGAGAVAHTTGTREIDRLGGLLKRMPMTGATFLVGAAAICGLPPLNGFVSELLIYLGSFQGLLVSGKPAAVAGAVLLTIGSLALIGGLAAACFTKAFGVVFLGEPRTGDAEHAHEANLWMRVPLILLATACGLIGLFGPLMPAFVGPAVLAVVPVDQVAAVSESLTIGRTALAGVLIGVAVFFTLAIAVWQLRARLLRGRPVSTSVTWDCGYAAPTPRMQYTASSFADPLVSLFRVVLGVRTEIHKPEGLFPSQASLHSETPELFRRRLFEPIFHGLAKLALRLHGLQQGRLQLYVLYIAVVLIVLLAWKLR